MEKLQKSDLKLLKLFTIASLLVVAPLLSTSIRFKYLYFIFNILIILVGAESGLLSFFLHSDTKNQDSVTHKEYSVSNTVNAASCYMSSADDYYYNKRPVVIGKKCSPEKILAGVKTAAAAAEMKKSPSTPSIFFIGEDTPARENVEEEEEEVDGDLISGQELFQKAEIFIGDFYKQLKMQREESWKKLHGRLSHQAF
ncbi:hypothetical protein ACP275_08G178400 [Erythranthe tilingii]